MDKTIPMENYIYVKPIEMVSSAIVLADEHKPVTNKGKIFAIGDNIKDVKVGDTILYGARGYNKYEDYATRKVYLVMDIVNVLAIVED